LNLLDVNFYELSKELKAELLELLREPTTDFDLGSITIFLNQNQIFLCLLMYNHKLSLCNLKDRNI
jgi:hypothetical protein